ncbi:alpha-ribazole phosphatase [Heliorestis acidaminivorans]|uniref:Alpha-ribazole phosphatase n=1 Tax=Heliorestis acidaminivorans TaxID=553427 RepID=A0A6I0ETS5_9FIRM|nr:alpha-ribazole phosphatase [Heliorestis acidaminivorans]KAB2954195.1 alpha-ribazole phosphatase [Heliorestis acidaminivorans]
MTKIFLIRHGETEWNYNRRYQGHSDVALSEKGRYQAQQLKNRLAHEKIDVLYASDLGRAVETAKIIAQEKDKEVSLDCRFRECHFGDWEGMTFQEIEEAYPNEIKLWTTKPGQLLIPGGESFATLQKRAYKALLEVVKKHQGENIAIVAHGGTIRSLLCAILDLDLDRAWQFKQDNTALNIISFHGESAIIETVNDCTHLLARAFPNCENKVE